ncbi:MAG: hypothetical protein D8M59_00760 [Planctomycetes bacterium]|nr:hypothetical protein [Planctomycetota bacterium]NOG54747.1 phosphotransferase [Planctomycetota bacterium]
MNTTGDKPSQRPPQPDATASLSDSELHLVSTTFGIGDVTQWQAITRGVGKADKFALRAATQDYLLKRRRWPTDAAASQQGLDRAAFRHALRRHLHQAGMPVEPYLTCSTRPASILLHSGRSYEVMRFVHGTEFARSTESCRDAGTRLSQMHEALSTFPYSTAAPISTCHDQDTLERRVQALQHRLTQSKQDAAYLLQLLDTVGTRYRAAAAHVDAQEYGKWPPILIHGDWHPGNLIFRDHRVVSILDFESAGRAPRAIDIACGALHFSIQAHGDDPQQWPDEPDELRWFAFCAGYDAFNPDHVLSRAEVRALPWLMIEALITEAVGALSATGKVGVVSARHMLEILVGKVGWLEKNAPRMIRVLE